MASRGEVFGSAGGRKACLSPIAELAKPLEGGGWSRRRREEHVMRALYRVRAYPMRRLAIDKPSPRLAEPSSVVLESCCGGGAVAGRLAEGLQVSAIAEASAISSVVAAPCEQPARAGIAEASAISVVAAPDEQPARRLGRIGVSSCDLARRTEAVHAAAYCL